MTNAEQKAKEIFSQLSGMEQRVIDILRERKQPLLARWQYDEAIPLITTALREAGNAKLEEAARVVERITQAQAEGWREHPKEDGCGGAIAVSNGGRFAAEAIRSLTEKD